MKKQFESERGVALLLVLFSLMLLMGLGLGLMYMTDTETVIGDNFRAGQQAYYASKGGLEEARDRLRWNAPGQLPLDAYATLPAAAANDLLAVVPTKNDPRGMVYITNPGAVGEVVQPWTLGNAFFDDQLCHDYPGLFAGLPVPLDTPCTAAPNGAGNYYTQVASIDPNTGTKGAIPYKWLRITLKQNNSLNPYCTNDPGGACNNLPNQPVCATSNLTQTVLPAGINVCEANNMRSVYMITSLAITPSGSRKMTQYEVAQVNIPPLPGAITFDGTNPAFGSPNSNAMVVNGNNIDSCGPPAAAVPAVSGLGAVATAQLAGQITRPANYTSNACGAVQPCVQDGTAQLGTLGTVGGLQTMVKNITASADQIFTAPAAPANLGNLANPLITVVNGDFNMGSASGAGLLLVTGNLIQTGNPNFSGVILLIGKGNLTKSGGGNGTFNGGIFLANLFDNTGNPLPAGSAPGTPTLNWGGGGTVTINYDSCWTNKLSNHAPFRVMSSREEIY